MKQLISLFLLWPALAVAQFERAHDADSVILGPLCTYATDGIEKVDIDFNTTNLLITIYASGDGVDTSFSYSGVNIDDYDGTPPAWGNPPASAVEVEDDDQCIRLHIRDEVLAVASATEWTVLIEDTTGTPTFMDTEYYVTASVDDAIKAETALIVADTNELQTDDYPARFDGVEGATFSSATDSLEAIRDQGDAAWTTGAGGSQPDVMVTTTIAGLTDQRTFTLTAGSADDGAYTACTAIITDAVTPTQQAYASIQSYTGGTKEVKLRYDPGVFTMATTDNVSIMCGPVMR